METLIMCMLVAHIWNKRYDFSTPGYAMLCQFLIKVRYVQIFNGYIR